MKRIVLVIASTFLLLQLHAQYSLDWAKTFGAQRVEFCYDMTVDPNGNVVYCGIFSDSTDLDPGPGVNMLYANGEYDICIFKTDGAGNFLWAKSIGGADEDVASAITTDAGGNVIVTGYYQLDTVDFDPGPGTYNFISTITRNAFTLKLDASGNFVWAASIAGTGGWDWAVGHDVQTDNAGNVCIAGEFIGLVDFDPTAGIDTQRTVNPGAKNAFVTRLAANGTYQWTNTFGGTTETIGYDLAIDNSGNIYTAGNFWGSADFLPGPGSYNLTSNGNRDIFATKWSPSGTLLWAIHFGGDSTDQGFGIDVSSSGSVILCGSFTRTADFDPDPSDTAAITSNGYHDAFVASYTSLGTFQWAKQVGGQSNDYFLDVTTDPNNNVYATGEFNGWFSGPDTIDFNPGPDTMLAYIPFSTDVGILKLDAAGDYSWHAMLTGNGTESSSAIAVAQGDDVFIAGAGGSNMNDYDPTPFTQPVTYAGSWDAFGVRLSQTCNTYGVRSVYGCGSYTVPSGNQTYYATGNVLDTIPNAAGCDSILLLNVTLLNTTASISPVVCDVYTSPDGNETYTQSGVCTDTLVNAAGCDSIITINLTVHHADTGAIYPATCYSYTAPSGNAVFNSSGVYSDTISTVHGCDSILTIYLTILPSTADTITATACLSYVSPDSNMVWTSSGMYTDTISNAAGCDSVITVQLTIIPVNATVSQFNNTLIAGAASAQLQWLDCNLAYSAIPNATQSLFVPLVDGSYALAVTENGCTDTSACETIIGIGIPEASQPATNVYPNPNNGAFTIIGNAQGPCTLTNAVGQIILRGELNASNAYTFSVSGLAAGVYFLETASGRSKIVCD